MPIWGAGVERKPVVGHPANSANVFATSQGWVHRWPWGDEVIVAIGGLANSALMGNASLDVVRALTANVTNAAAQTLSVLIQFNEAVSVTGTPTVVAINSASPSPANATLSYDSSVSDPAAGKLVFRNTNVGLAQANAVGTTFRVNSTSVLSGWNGITDLANGNAVANSIPAALSATITVA